MMSDEDLVLAFERGTLDPGAFPHREHVRMAWIYVRRYGLAEALTRFCAGIRALSGRAGKPEHYHETVTWAYLLLINDRVARQRNGNEGDHHWDAFAAANADLLTNGRRVLERWYHPETLESAVARETFVWPDKQGSTAARAGGARQPAPDSQS